MPRLTKDSYFILMAIVASLRSTCKSRQIGAVFVDENYHVLSTGYNGPAKGLNTCDPCHRSNAPSGHNLNKCMAVHAEQNALLQCSNVNIINTLYVTVSPCFECIKVLLNTPCDRIIYLNDYTHTESKHMWVAMNRQWIKYKFSPSDINVVSNMFGIKDVEMSHIIKYIT